MGRLTHSTPSALAPQPATPIRRRPAAQQPAPSSPLPSNPLAHGAVDSDGEASVTSLLLLLLCWWSLVDFATARSRAKSRGRGRACASAWRARRRRAVAGASRWRRRRWGPSAPWGVLPLRRRSSRTTTASCRAVDVERGLRPNGSLFRHAMSSSSSRLSLSFHEELLRLRGSRSGGREAGARPPRARTWTPPSARHGLVEQRDNQKHGHDPGGAQPTSFPSCATVKMESEREGQIMDIMMDLNPRTIPGSAYQVCVLLVLPSNRVVSVNCWFE